MHGHGRFCFAFLSGVTLTVAITTNGYYKKIWFFFFYDLAFCIWRRMVVSLIFGESNIKVDVRNDS